MAVTKETLGNSHLPRPDNLHITLVFLGVINVQQQTQLETAVASISEPGFRLTIDRLGAFSRARVLWLGMHAVPPELKTLQSVVEQRLRTALPGLSVWDRQPDGSEYVPHVTIQRKFSAAVPSRRFTPVTWAVNDFCLFESVSSPNGSVYRILHRWPLLD